MIDSACEGPAELSAEEISAVSGGNGYFGSGHRDGGGMSSSGG